MPTSALNSLISSDGYIGGANATGRTIAKSILASPPEHALNLINTLPSDQGARNSLIKTGKNYPGGYQQLLADLSNAQLMHHYEGDMNLRPGTPEYDAKVRLY